MVRRHETPNARVQPTTLRVTARASPTRLLLLLRILSYMWRIATPHYVSVSTMATEIFSGRYLAPYKCYVVLSWQAFCIQLSNQCVMYEYRINASWMFLLTFIASGLRSLSINLAKVCSAGLRNINLFHQSELQQDTWWLQPWICSCETVASKVIAMNGLNSLGTVVSNVIASGSKFFANFKNMVVSIAIAWKYVINHIRL